MDGLHGVRDRKDFILVHDDLRTARYGSTRTPCIFLLSQPLSMKVWTVEKLPTVPERLNRLRLKYDGTRAETRFRLSAKRTNPFQSAGASVQSITGSWGVRISGSNAGYTMFRGGVKGIGYPLHSPASPSLPLPCVIVCHHDSAWLYHDATILQGLDYLIPSALCCPRQDGPCQSRSGTRCVGTPDKAIIVHL